MLFSFFLKKILQKALTIPVAAGMVYPTLSGTLIVRSLELQPPQQQEHKVPSLFVRKAIIDPNWRTLFDPLVHVERVEFRGLRAQVNISDPVLLLHCLHNNHCVSPARFAAQRARIGVLPEAAQAAGAEPENLLEPLQVRADAAVLVDGEITLFNGSKQLHLEIVEASAKRIKLPLSEEPIALRADVLVRDSHEGPAVPVRILLTWDGQTEVLQVAMTLKKLPVQYLEQMFPQLQAQASKLLGGLEPGGGAGMLSGSLSLEYRASEHSGRKWRLR